MKYSIRIITLFILSFLLVGCNANDEIKDEKKGETAVASQASNTVIGTKKVTSTVTIKSYYSEPASINDKNTVVLGDTAKSEYVEMVIQGKITDFKIVELEWDNSKNELVEKEAIDKIESLVNSTVVIRTLLPEGIPSQKIKWKSETGKEYEYIIADNNLGDKGNSEKIINMQ